MSHANDLLRILSGGKEDKPVFAIASIPSSYSGTGRPTLLFDGEQTATTRQYPYLGSYTPTAGDRVLVALLTNSGCILGKIT